MMNQHLKNLNKIEFVVTYACTGRCKHCSEGDHAFCGERIDPGIAADAVRKIGLGYDIKTVMTFGGEPLLCLDAVCAIHRAATEMGVPRRQVITNGYVTRDNAKMQVIAARLAEVGVNDLLLSVDAFHQETIPVEIVAQFATALLNAGVPVRSQPAWLVSETDDNPYNRTTRELLAKFAEMGISANDGNVIFPEGNAKVYLGEYFTGEIPENPYVEDPADLRCLSVDADGGLLGENIYKTDVMTIIEAYKGE